MSPCPRAGVPHLLWGSLPQSLQTSWSRATGGPRVFLASSSVPAPALALLPLVTWAQGFPVCPGVLAVGFEGPVLTCGLF